MTKKLSLIMLSLCISGSLLGQPVAREEVSFMKDCARGASIVGKIVGVGSFFGAAWKGLVGTIILFMDSNQFRETLLKMPGDKKAVYQALGEVGEVGLQNQLMRDSYKQALLYSIAWLVFTAGANKLHAYGSRRNRPQPQPNPLPKVEKVDAEVQTEPADYQGAVVPQ